MKLTWIGPYKPVPDRSGADLRSYYLMRELARRGAEISAAFLGSHGEACDEFLHESRVIEPGFVRPILRAGRRRFAGEPLTVGRFHHPDLVEFLTDDSLVYVDHLHLATNVVEDSSISYWLDEHNFETSLWEQYANRSWWPRRLFLRTEASAMRRFELEAIRGSAGTSIPSLRDVEDLPSDVRDRVREIPNGVPDDWLKSGRKRLDEPVASRGIFGFIGKYDWFPNRLGVDEFLSDVWGPFHEQQPDTRLKLAGDSPPGAWRDYDGVDVLGYVDSTQDFYESIDALVLPLAHGSGTRLKALEAAAKGIPLISTEKGTEGLDLPDQATASTIGDLRELLEAFRDDPGQWQSKRKEAHRSVEESYRWEAIGERLWEALQSSC